MAVLKDSETRFRYMQLLFPLSVQFCSLGGFVDYAYTQSTTSLILSIERCGMAMALQK